MAKLYNEATQEEDYMMAIEDLECLIEECLAFLKIFECTFLIAWKQVDFLQYGF